ncbi:peptidyl-prolyl cis-trans isomerase FKBP53 [Cryptomeria japonica]|uniref:peptidyl-prolyl cis-trans isomerase FKBP53 n=1 Tax=Cryptomeria japonica TaxID=3369 RepID=UPI0027D9E891|nr:peptidyl-prolyl cis-trans isomerase FKBP53 [Cryptomeria japonica]
MAFWGVEVKSGKPVTLNYDSEKGRLHLTQATLGLGSFGQRSVVQCNVGDRPGVLLCSLSSGKTEACSLNLQLEEEEEVTFSVLGPISIHLTGYYMSPNRERLDNSDTSGEDITGDSEDYDDFSNDDDYEEDFIDDDDMIVSSGAPNSGVRIEEIEDDEPPKEHIKDTMKKKKKDEEQQKAISPVNGAVGDCKSISDINKNESGQELTEQENHISESEDGDGFPIRMKRKRRANSQAEPLPKKQAIEGNSGDATDPSKLTAPDVPEESKLSKKKKKKLKKKGNRNEMEGISGNANNGLEKIEQMSVPSDKVEQEMERGNNVRTFPNGLVIEELSMGKPDGKKAAPGNKVSVYYTGKLKKNGKIFDSNIGRKPFKFRLGVGEVISGWDVGVKGMRVGDKRRLTIPPAMGYGAAGAGEIPGNAWLVFDVELVNAK